MTRDQIVLRHINKSGRGIEIGASHNPIASKKDGFDVHTIDYMDRGQLVQKYKGHGVNIENIEEVDFVWRGEKYVELTGKSKYYDWIIASHVIEHTPDLIGFLNECDSILKDDGVLSLVVPDRRYCFDYYRPITGIGKIIDNWFQNTRFQSPGSVAEYVLNVVSKEGSIAWDSSTPGEMKFVHSVEDAIREMNLAREGRANLDVHVWCFVPHSFRLIMRDLFQFRLIHLQEISFSPTINSEFYVTMGRSGKGSKMSRMEMLRVIDGEIQYGIDKSNNAVYDSRA